MGLDMYFYATKAALKNDANDEIALNAEHFNSLLENGDASELYYMRKENAVHGFIADDYFESGGMDDEFNCVCYEITHLIEPLKQACQNKELVPRNGFFFGSTNPDDIDYDNIMDFVEQAEQAIKEGDEIIYRPDY